MNTKQRLISLEMGSIEHINVITQQDATGVKIPKVVADFFGVEHNQHVGKMLFHHLAQSSIHHTAMIQEARNYFYQLKYTDA